MNNPTMTRQIPHNDQRWSVCTNRHPTTFGYSWGWIEGAPGNVTWSNDSSFDRLAAEALCKEHNDWLEVQTPIAKRIVRQMHVIDSLTHRRDSARQAAELAQAELDAATNELARLEAQT